MEPALTREYKAIFKHSRDAIYITTSDGTYIDANQATLDLFGYTREEMRKVNAGQLYADPADARRFQKEIRNKGFVRDFEVRLCRKDGTVMDCLLTVTEQQGDNEDILEYQGIIRDITERKQAEELLQQERETFSTILENALYGVVLMDKDGKHLYVNPTFTAITGYTLEDIPTGRDWMHKAYPDKEYRQKVREFWQKDGQVGKSTREVSIVCKDGGIKEIEFRRTQLADGRAIVMLADITERKRSEEKLRESEKRFRLLVEHSKDAFFLHDFDGKIIDVNQHACESLGYTREELLGLSIQDIDEGFGAGRHKEKWQQMVLGEPITLEGVHRRKDGTTFPVEVRLGVFESGASRLLLGLVRDITERKRIEERLQRYAAELERSNEEVKNFAYIVSHDLRVPLVNLKGYSTELRSALEVIGSNFDAALPYLNDGKRSEVAMALHEDAPEALEFITTSVSRMDSFINAVLLLSRLGRRDLKPEPIDMNALVQTILGTLSYQIEGRGITVAVKPLPHVVADHTSMEQVMGNILGNAVKYLDSSRPGRIEVFAQVNGMETIFSIRDNGRGIAEDDMDKVFAPFRRAGKQDTPGEGMGLAYVQTLVRRHNGRIWCESELGKGTTFTFTLATPAYQGAHNV
jgi:PAS domain S-box-containing protein